MGTTTANMSIYVPSQGETVYSAEFLAGMQHIDTHDHTGAPQNGVKLGASSLLDCSITPDKLVPEVGGEVMVQTTDGSATQAAAVDLAEGSCITINGRFSFIRDDFTEGGGGNFYASFRRPSGGNVTLIGTQVVNINEDSSGSPTITITADVGNQTIDINCVGEAGKTIDWTVFYNTTGAPNAVLTCS